MDYEKFGEDQDIIKGYHEIYNKISDSEQNDTENITILLSSINRLKTSVSMSITNFKKELEKCKILKAVNDNILKILNEIPLKVSSCKNHLKEGIIIGHVVPGEENINLGSKKTLEFKDQSEILSKEINIRIENINNSISDLELLLQNIDIKKSSIINEVGEINDQA